MKMMLQIGLVFAICLFGQIVSAFLPIAIPGSVISMVILFLLLVFKIVKVDHIRQKADFLLKNMAFFFIPAGVGIIANFDSIKNSILPLLVVVCLTTLLTFGSTALVVQGVMGLQDKLTKKGKKKSQGGLAMKEVFASPFFGITLSILTFEIGVWIEKKTKIAIANPLLIAVILCILILKVFNIPLESYNAGGNVIAVFLGPATAVLALSIYTQFAKLKKYFIPVLAGTVVGSAVSISSAYFLCKAFQINVPLTESMLVKSVSTPFAMAISKNIGGIPAVSVAAVVLTGILGAVFAPLLIKLFHVKNPIAVGVAIGTSSHAVGTSKAIAIGEVEGAMSGIAIGMAGIVTVIISLFIR